MRACHLSICTRHDFDACAARFTPVLRLRRATGVHETTVTRPDLFRAYLTEQIRLLIDNHSVPVEIGESGEPIPVHFAYRRDINIEAVLSGDRKSMLDQPLRDLFDTPELAAMDDAIANGTLQLPSGSPEPLALFRAARVDYS